MRTLQSLQYLPQMKNIQSREVNTVIIDMIQGLDLVLKTSMKLLELNGVIGGKN